MSSSSISTATSAPATPTSSATATRSLSVDCRKFSANIFNKSKCSHCFRQREEHSAAALECNRACRKVSKCGYLFVAPDWDFSNPLYRTKRWQRRWFVLYDDGELTYSVDDYPETVPQACIDMSKVLEVATAEDITSHPNSIAITAPDRVTFIKGTSPEESQWWFNILAAFPKSKGRHKRSVTLPGGLVTSILQAKNSDSSISAAVNCHNSYHKGSLTTSQSASNLLLNNKSESNDTASTTTVTTSTGRADDDDEDDGVETGEDDDDDDISPTQHAAGASIKSMKTSSTCLSDQDENNRNAGNEITNRVSQPTSCLLIEGIRRDEKTIKDIANTITNLSQQQNKRWSTAVNNVLNNHHHYQQKNQQQHQNQVRQHHSHGQSSRDETDFQVTGSKSNSIQNLQTQSVHLRPKSLPLASNSTPAIVSAIVKKIPTVMVSQQQQLQQITPSTGSKNIHQANKSKSSPRFQLKQLQQHQLEHQPQQHYTHERGDPDGGCNLDDLSSNYLAKTDELRSSTVVTVATSKASSKESTSATVKSSPLHSPEELLNAKKGWLMKQDNRTGDWSKHWFTLSGAALFYYRDPLSEERGVLDGVLDVNSLTNVLAEISSTKQYAFQLITWDKQRLMLASLSSNSRNSWIAVLCNAAGLPQVQEQQLQKQHIETSITTHHNIKNEIEQDFLKAQLEENFQSNSTTLPMRFSKDTKNVSSPVTPTIPRTSLPGSHFSSEDEEYRTASEGGRRDSIDWGSPLSPSPPIPQISYVRTNKERCIRAGTSSNCPRFHKRSRSSPPSSRQSTVDSVGSDELPPTLQMHIHTVKEEQSLDKSLSHRLVSNEEKTREACMSELLSTLQRTEQQLNTRIQEMELEREQLNTELGTAKKNAIDTVGNLRLELGESQSKIKQLEDRLVRGIEENESLYKRLREVEIGSNSLANSLSNLNRHKIKRMDSLSDLTTISDIDPYCLERDLLAEEYNELRTRFEKAVNEIKAMKRELKESQNQFDSLEISYAALRQDLERKANEDQSQLQMMAARIQDLTLKFSSSERQVRALKQKLAKSERRRSLSLKGKEQSNSSKDIIERDSTYDPSTSIELKPSGNKKATRRRSLDCAQATLDSAHSFLMRISDSDKRPDNTSACSTPPSTKSASPTSETTGQPQSTLTEHLISRLRSLEHVLLACKDRVEQSLHQFQQLRTQRTRRSVSPITDRKDCYRYVERSMTEVVKLIHESCETCVVIDPAAAAFSNDNSMILADSAPVKLAITQLEAQLRNKQHTVNFHSDRQILADISNFLGQLEDSLIALQCEATAAEAATSTIPRAAIEIECLQDVCHKCCDLRQRADQLLQEVHRKLSAPCAQCLQLQAQYCSLEAEIVQQQQSQAIEHNKLIKQAEQQHIALKQMESARDALNSDLNRSEELIDERERELILTKTELESKIKELGAQNAQQLQLSKHLDAAVEKAHGYQEESEALILKCARHDEQYALLLHERDNLSSMLGKEQERSKRLERRLELLEREHGKQLECLQEAYREQLLTHNTEIANAPDGKSFRQRYQAEIEQLRTLCEKGLTAMESSHRRIVSDLEEKHKHEIEHLLAEKETALAEETQATLAALDAMRKAHQSEVQREVARFKQEFLRQVQRGEHTHGDNAKLKEEELEELRHEILSFSEKYSIKCVENAALEEKLRISNGKLKQFQQMQQLELRNKQFRAHLESDDPSTDVNFVQGLTMSSKEEPSFEDSEHPPRTMASPTDTATNTILPGNLDQNLLMKPCNILSRYQPHTSNVSDYNGNDAYENSESNRSLLQYEPCYKSNDIFAIYQNRLNLQGLKQNSTFGKSLRKPIHGKSSHIDH